MTKPDPMPAGTTAAVPSMLLGHHLKQLKLPTVLREYDKVARECAGSCPAVSVTLTTIALNDSSSRWFGIGS